MKRPPADNWIFAVGLAAVAALVFFVARNFSLSIYYDSGTQVLDAGWLSGLMHGNDWRLSSPIAVGDSVGDPGESFYRVHVSPFFTPLTYLGPLLTSQPAVFTAAVMGVAYAVYAVALCGGAFGFLRAVLPAKIAIAIAIAAAIVLAFNGAVIEVLIFPHYEIWLSSLLCLFLLLLAHGKIRAAACCFVALMTIREDAGFHLAAVLGAVVAINQLSGAWQVAAQLAVWRAQRRQVLWGAAAFFCSLIAINVGGLEARSPSVFGGDLVVRFFSVITRGDWLPAIVVLAAWCAFFRRALPMAGFLSCIPWTLYNTSIEEPVVGNLIGYYGFPFLVGFFFPFVSDRFAVDGGGKKTAKRGKKRSFAAPPRPSAALSVAFVVVFAASSLLLRPAYTTPIKYEGRPWTKVGIRYVINHGLSSKSLLRERAGRLLDFYLAERERLRFLVGDSFAALFPHDVPYSDKVFQGKWQLEHDDADVMIFQHVSGFGFLEAKPFYAARGSFGLGHIYALEDTHFLLVSREPLCDAEGCLGDLPLSPRTMPDRYADQAAMEFARDGFNFHAAAIARDKSAKDGEEIVVVAPGEVAFIRDLPLPAGETVIDAVYRHDIDGPAPILTALWEGGGATTTLHSQPDADSLAGGRVVARLPTRQGVDIRVIHNGGGEFRLHGVLIRPPPR